MSEVWTGIAEEFLHLYPMSGRLLAVAGADAARSRLVADEVAAALASVGQTVEQAHSIDGDEKTLRAEVITPFRADAARDRVLIVSGPAALLSPSARGLWNFTVWQLSDDEPPQTAASALVDITDSQRPARRFADYCALPSSYGA
ncbi:hypothetical protein [uncultured Microbacterium sp.]|uniref:hypothetical protein n=1 Tax=uncultured Microbacterium sp. TaxID=191216 RepID=UPI0026159C84|nr:hypothetical protein [uncultured Microbacterium sp.]